ncbi:MAG: RdgB/HAM1 family non-canonical purine NTP pyrophosphatase [Candidatus Dormibacteraceae bacterium]
MGRPPRLVIASGNPGKLQEYRDLLSDAGFELVAFDSEVDEVGETYEQNARLKAEAAAERSGLPSLGDDSGLELDVLGGFPGVRSARLAPTQSERTAELWRRLEGHPRPWHARFICIISLAAPGSQTRCFQGECRGELLPQARGRNGFGYDPVFYVPADGKTFGEMPPAEKRQYSHRAAAVQSLLESGALKPFARSIT